MFGVWWLWECQSGGFFKPAVCPHVCMYVMYVCMSVCFLVPHSASLLYLYLLSLFVVLSITPCLARSSPCLCSPRHPHHRTFAGSSPLCSHTAQTSWQRRSKPRSPHRQHRKVMAQSLPDTHCSSVCVCVSQATEPAFPRSVFMLHKAGFLYPRCFIRQGLTCIISRYCVIFALHSTRQVKVQETQEDSQSSLDRPRPPTAVCALC